jgi:pimeloyl-ACP methyl ester carboxylesterase
MNETSLQEGQSRPEAEPSPGALVKSTRIRHGRRPWLPLLLFVVPVLLVISAQWFVIHEIERQVLEPVNRPQGGLSVADDLAARTRGLNPEAFDRKWFSGHRAVPLPDAAATLHVWRFDPWHQENGATDEVVSATVLLLPGWGGTAMHSQYLFLLAQFCRAEGCRVLLVDLRGQGCSTGGPCSYGYLDAGDLKHLSATLRTEGMIAGPVILAGHSYGAISALQAAPVVPEVIGVMAFSGPKDLFAVAATSRQLAAGTFPALYPLARPFLSDAAFRFAVTNAARRHGFEAAESSALNAIQRFRGPVFIGHGEDDLDVPVSNAIALRDARPGQTELHLYPKADHSAYLLSEANVAPVRDWLKRLLANAEAKSAPRRGLPSQAASSFGDGTTLRERPDPPLDLFLGDRRL